MKKFLFSIFIFSTITAAAQNAEVSRDASGNKILKGFINAQELKKDTSFTWYAQSTKTYVPEAGALAAFTAQKDSVYILAFGGTWCGDTKQILPQIITLTESAGWSPSHFTLLGVDRAKKTVNNLTEAFNVSYVPTFIVLKGGKEIGRVVEWGTTGRVDKELGAIVAKSIEKK